LPRLRIVGQASPPIRATENRVYVDLCAQAVQHRPEAEYASVKVEEHRLEFKKIPDDEKIVNEEIRDLSR